MLVGGAVGLAALATALGGALWQSRTSPDVVRLGMGVASVEAQPVAEASYYGNELSGNRTASGESFDPNKLTAAHRTLPHGSRVRVTNSRRGESVVVRINDRGPFHGNRVIDLLTAAARTIGLISSGTGG